MGAVGGGEALAGKPAWPGLALSGLQVILASLTVCGLCGTGLIAFSTETNMVRLWLPQVKCETKETCWGLTGQIMPA